VGVAIGIGIGFALCPETAMETFGGQFRSHDLKLGGIAHRTWLARGHAGRAGDQMAVVDNHVVYD
jgi:hypothetical protein